jgi:hypothetical protein
MIYDPVTDGEGLTDVNQLANDARIASPPD